MNLIAGSYVTHARLPELGSGEILGFEDGKVRIRFASGDKAFMYDRVIEHLTVTNEAPVNAQPKAATGKKRKTKAKA